MKIDSLADLTAAIETEIETADQSEMIFVKAFSESNCTYIRYYLTKAIASETDPAAIEKLRHLVALFQ